MPDADDLERRLRAALADVPVGPPPPGARRVLAARLRSRRSRRRQMVASGAAVVLLAGGAAAYGLSSARQPATTAGGPVHAVAGGPAPREGKAGHVPRPSASHAGSATALPDLSCARVRVGGAPAACAGAYSRPPTFGVEQRSGDQVAAGASSSSAGAVMPGTPATPTSPAAPEELAVGQSITVALPAATGLAWVAPHVEQSVPAGAGAPPSTTVVRTVASRTGHPAGAASASFVATHQGAVVLEAGAAPACGASRGTCGAVQVTWSLSVTVEGS